MTARGASFALITVLCVLWVGGRLPDPAVFLADPDWGHQTAGANQILLGEHPFIDFRSTYGPLTFYASALAHVLSGGRVVGEMALVVLGYALAYVLLFRLMRIAAHTARVAWPVTVAALILMPRLYKYYIVLAPALTLTAAWAHVDRPGGRTVWALGFAIALAGLFRPDFGAFAALTGIAAVALRPAPGPAVRLWRILGLLGAVLACATPWLLWVGVRGGLGEYIADSIVGAPRHAAGMALPLPVLHGPESTHAGATALLAAFVFFAVLPLAAVVVLLFRRVAVDVGERARVLTLVVLAQATLLQAAHRSEVQHLLQAIPASFVLVAWLIGVAARRLGAGTGWGRGAAVPGLAALVAGGAVTIAMVAPLRPWPDPSPAALVRKLRLYARSPAAYLDAMRTAAPSSWQLEAMAYVRACTRPTERILALPLLTNFYYLTGRRFGGGQMLLAPGYFSSRRDQQRMIARVSSEDVAVVVNVPDVMIDERPERSPRVFAPIVSRYLDEQFIPVGRLGPAAVAVPRERTGGPSGPMDIPCPTPPRS